MCSIKTMKRFLLFYGDHYYPEGGWKDYETSFDSKAEAREFMEIQAKKHELSDVWFHVVNSERGTVVIEGEFDFLGKLKIEELE